MTDDLLTDLRKFLDLYAEIYMGQTHPSVIEECRVMNKANELREKWGGPGVKCLTT